MTEPTLRTWSCIRCSAPVAIPAIAEGAVQLAGFTFRCADGRIYLYRAGAIVALYCPACADGLRLCRMCGCTEECACLPAVARKRGTGACFWVAEDLCSACYVPDERYTGTRLRVMPVMVASGRDLEEITDFLRNL